MPQVFAEAGCVYMAHSPLARGVLASARPLPFAAGDYRGVMPALSIEGQAKIRQRAALNCIDIGGRDGLRSTLRWVLKQGANVIAVVGARSAAQVNQAAAALN